MKAMILAAGLGTRLGDLTKDRPKALVPFVGRPMLEGLLLRLKAQGFDDILINLHHHADQVMTFVEDHQAFGLKIRFSHEKEALLDTGGALAYAHAFFREPEPVLIHNVDVYSDLDLGTLMEYHMKQNYLATLVVRKRETNRQLLFNETMLLRGWKNARTHEKKWIEKPLERLTAFAFSGIYVADPLFVDKLPFSGAFSIIDAWLKMAVHHPICGWRDEHSRWYDLGSAERIRKAEEELLH